MAFFDDMTDASAANPTTDVGEPSTLKIRISNNTRRRALVAFAAVLTVSLGATSHVGAGALKCKPTVTVTNSRPGGSAAIKVLSFKYKIGDNRIYTEGLTNKVLTPGQFEDWPSQTLANAANGVTITSSAVELQVDNGRGWDPLTPLVWFPHTFACGENHHYNHVIK